jgi:hypothetical protein
MGPARKQRSNVFEFFLKARRKAPFYLLGRNDFGPKRTEHEVHYGVPSPPTQSNNSPDPSVLEAEYRYARAAYTGTDEAAPSAAELAHFLIATELQLALTTLRGPRRSMLPRSGPRPVALRSRLAGKDPQLKAVG